MKTVYKHTNIIARDWQSLARFYEEVFGVAIDLHQMGEQCRLDVDYGHRVDSDRSREFSYIDFF